MAFSLNVQLHWGDDPVRAKQLNGESKMTQWSDAAVAKYRSDKQAYEAQTERVNTLDRLKRDGGEDLWKSFKNQLEADCAAFNENENVLHVDSNTHHIVRIVANLPFQKTSATVRYDDKMSRFVVMFNTRSVEYQYPVKVVNDDQVVIEDAVKKQYTITVDALCANILDTLLERPKK